MPINLEQTPYAPSRLLQAYIQIDTTTTGGKDYVIINPDASVTNVQLNVTGTAVLSKPTVSVLPGNYFLGATPITVGGDGTHIRKGGWSSVWR